MKSRRVMEIEGAADGGGEGEINMRRTQENLHDSINRDGKRARADDTSEELLGKQEHQEKEGDSSSNQTLKQNKNFSSICNIEILSTKLPPPSQPEQSPQRRLKKQRSAHFPGRKNNSNSNNNNKATISRRSKSNYIGPSQLTTTKSSTSPSPPPPPPSSSLSRSLAPKTTDPSSFPNSSLPISDLPSELIVHIFTFLGLRDLARASSVCKQWRVASCNTSILWREVDLVNDKFANYNSKITTAAAAAAAAAAASTNTMAMNNNSNNRKRPKFFSKINQSSNNNNNNNSSSSTTTTFPTSTMVNDKFVVNIIKWCNSSSENATCNIKRFRYLALPPIPTNSLSFPNKSIDTHTLIYPCSPSACRLSFIS